jgi:hypothetical protein
MPVPSPPLALLARISQLGNVPLPASQLINQQRFSYGVDNSLRDRSGGIGLHEVSRLPEFIADTSQGRPSLRDHVHLHILQALPPASPPTAPTSSPSASSMDQADEHEKQYRAKRGLNDCRDDARTEMDPELRKDPARNEGANDPRRQSI